MKVNLKKVLRFARSLLLLFIILLNSLPVLAIDFEDLKKSKVNWEELSKNSFDKARKSNKLILLFIDNNWSHDAHVMRNHTFRHPKVANFIKQHFIAIKVDSDLRPDLLNKYEKYAWPVTVVFDGIGQELMKRARAISPEELITDLRAIVKTPEPEVNRDLDESELVFSSNPYLASSLRDQLLFNHKDFYDPEVGGLQEYRKYLDGHTLEYSLAKAKNGSELDQEIVRSTLSSALALSDPIWGGFYHYSTKGDWLYPSYEKLSFDQGKNLKLYSQAYTLFDEMEYIDTAISIHQYLTENLRSNEGVFYSGQDADLIRGEDSSIYYELDEESRKSLGVPKIDKAIYTNYNGIVIDGLIELYKATKNKKYLDEARQATDWILKNRLIKASKKEVFNWLFKELLASFDYKTFWAKCKQLYKNGFYQEIAFYHSNDKKNGTYLSDNLYMGIAFLKLYEITKEKDWLLKAEQLARFINKKFKSKNAGYRTDIPKEKFFLESFPIISTSENVDLVRFTSKLYMETKRVDYRNIAEHAMYYLATPEIALKKKTNSGILLAEMAYLESMKIF